MTASETTHSTSQTPTGPVNNLIKERFYFDYREHPCIRCKRCDREVNYITAHCIFIHGDTDVRLEKPVNTNLTEWKW